MPKPPRSPYARMMERTVRTDTGCLVYTGALKDDGYGVVFIGEIRGLDGHGNPIRKQVHGRAHVIAWEEVHGPVPAGHVLEHDCCTRDLTCEGGRSCPHRACVDETHLRPVTPIENTALGNAHRRARMEKAA